MLKECLTKITRKEDLSRDECYRATKEMLSGGCSPVMSASFIAALSTKGETKEEITGATLAVRELALPINHDGANTVDLCGTGGDGKHTFNISTIASFVAAGAGAVVAKHGNRAVSSSCGSADLLEGLGVNIMQTPETVAKCLLQAGIGFMFAPAFHPAMKNVSPVRKEMGIRTIFNLIGPLANPVRLNAQLIGVFNPHLLIPFAQILRELGIKRAIVVHGKGGYDEATTADVTDIVRLHNGTMELDLIRPEQLGFEIANHNDLIGGDLSNNIKVCHSILHGEGGPKFDTVILNAALALVASGMAADCAEGVAMAKKSVSSGKALAALRDLVELSNGEQK